MKNFKIKALSILLILTLVFSLCVGAALAGEETGGSAGAPTEGSAGDAAEPDAGRARKLRRKGQSGEPGYGNAGLGGYGQFGTADGVCQRTERTLFP